MFLNEISDDLLIRLYREGNQTAIDLLYERYNVFLYGFIHQILKNEDYRFDYKELFQELFIVFFNCLERYDEENGCFYYFVKRSAERKVFDFIYKANKSRNILSLDNFYYFDGLETCADYIEEENLETYYQTDLYKMLEENLSEEEMNIIDLKVEGYSYQEISKILNISKQTIYRKVVIIKNVIKDIIEKID